MQENIQSIAEPDLVTRTGRQNFNFNKLQAVLCIAGSALVSGTIIAWLIRNFL